jgi:hypothetical protein
VVVDVVDVVVVVVVVGSGTRQPSNGFGMRQGGSGGGWLVEVVDVVDVEDVEVDVVVVLAGAVVVVELGWSLHGDSGDTGAGAAIDGGVTTTGGLGVVVVGAPLSSLLPLALRNTAIPMSASTMTVVLNATSLGAVTSSGCGTHVHPRTA